MIKLLNSLYLTEKGCCIKNRKFYPVHLRQGEIDGLSYHFVDKYTFADMVHDGRMLEYTKFNNHS